MNRLGRRVGPVLGAALCVLVFAPVAVPSTLPGIVCTLKPGESTLPAATRRGLAHHLQQYPDLTLATAPQRQAATQLLARVRAATLPFRDIRKAAARGFATDPAKRAQGDDAVGYLHAEHRRWSADRHDLDPKRPESLIYSTEPGRKPVLIGVMFAVARGVAGPTPAGPIARWHSHLVCATEKLRGVKPPPSGRCPTGSRLTQGSEMLHVWFTSDLRSAFAIHAPVPELCRDGLLTPEACRSGANHREM